MKSKVICSLLMAGMSVSAFAQTHKEGAEYYKADQLENAKELLLRNYDNAATDKAIANYYLGLIALREGKKPEAAKYFDLGVSINPEFGYNYVGQGELALLDGDLKTAEKLFKTAEGKAKKDAALDVAIARAYYNADPVAYQKKIDDKMKKARDRNLEEPDIYLFEGDVLKASKDINNAANKYEMASNFDNNAPEAFVKYANLFTNIRPDYAIVQLKKLLANNPESALGQRELANAYYNKQDYVNAATEYGKYVNNPNHFKQDEDRFAFLLFYGQKYQDGYNYASKLLAENPSNFTAQRYQFMNAAQIPAMKDQLLPMAEKLYAAHLSNKDNKFAPIDYTLIADELTKAGRPEEGVKVLTEAISEMPDNASFNKQLAMTYVEMNQIANAADAFTGYIEKTAEPGYNDYIQQATFSYYGGIETREADPERSAKYFADTLNDADLAAKVNPAMYKPAKIKGDVAKMTAGKDKVMSAAVPSYLEAITLLEASENPSRYATDAKELYNYMGNYYLDMKDVAKAKEYFNKYLIYDPDNNDYRKFVESL